MFAEDGFVAAAAGLWYVCDVEGDELQGMRGGKSGGTTIEQRKDITAPEEDGNCCKAGGMGGEVGWRRCDRGGYQVGGEGARLRRRK